MSSPAASTIRDILARATAPVPLKALVRQSHLTAEVLQQTLTAEQGRDGIFRWPDLRGSQRFWSIAPAEYGRQQILELASQCALPAGELARQARQKAHGYPEKLLRSLVQQLIKDKELRKYSGFGRESGLIGRAGHPAAYAAAARRFIEDKIAAKVRAEGGSLDAVAPQSSPLDSAAAILAAMHRLEPSGSAPVSVRELRTALPAIAKPAFDDAALALWRGQKVFLSRHDYPQSLSQEDKDLLIDGGDGTYYVAITPRQD